MRRIRVGIPYNGHCPICEGEAVFFSNHEWLRDNLKCTRCSSIPRYRAIVKAINRYAPNWRNLRMHESSPGGAASDYLCAQCKDYSRSHYLPHVTAGEYSGIHNACSQNLEALTFEADCFDLFITQDVLEHVLDPLAAMAEIARVLVPGGVHLFTVPWYPEETCSRYRARERDGVIHHLAPPTYHGNPLTPDGSLVTVDWGRDLPDIIFNASGLLTTIHEERDTFYGLEGEFLEVFISRKPVKTMTEIR